ncbi:MAG: hypothetical protein ACJ746_27020 [Bryobacteraceae bacterium]
MEGVLVAMHHDVIWANGMDGGHVHGRDEVRCYWTRQWALVDPGVAPVEFSRGKDRDIVVDVTRSCATSRATSWKTKWLGTSSRSKMA